MQKNPDIDIILMDIQMPIMNGYEAIKKIREFNEDVIIITQSAFVFTDEAEKAIKKLVVTDTFQNPLIK
jgi:CheY-like chemotaxis protein